MKFIATTAYGLEGALSREMKALGFQNIVVDTSRVTFEGDLADGCRANLMLRSAGRVRIEVGSIEAKTFDDLHDGVLAMPWENFIERGFTVTVTARSVKSKLHAEPSIQAVAHKAICRRLCEKYNVSKLVGKSKYTIEVHLYRDRAVLSLDTSGQPLHMRGYRVLNPEAALRETLAGALVVFSGWRYDWPMVDPFCGSGTLLVEAAMAARNMPPGGNREFIGEKFPWWDKAIWDEQREKALDEINWEPIPPIRGFDIDPKVISMAKTHARRGGVTEDITLAVGDATTMQLEEERGHIITNPPYGIRLSNDEGVKKLYRDFGKRLKDHSGWSCHMITARQDTEHLMGMKANKKRKVYNGRIPCQYFQFFGRRSS